MPFATQFPYHPTESLPSRTPKPSSNISSVSPIHTIKIHTPAPLPPLQKKATNSRRAVHRCMLGKPSWKLYSRRYPSCYLQVFLNDRTPHHEMCRSHHLERKTAHDPCVKRKYMPPMNAHIYILSLGHRAEDLNFEGNQCPITLFKDNQGCVDWFKSTTSKGTKHISLCENAVQEYVQYFKEFSISHINGNINSSDIFTMYGAP